MVHQNKLMWEHDNRESDTKEGIQKIVMLTNFIENNRQKCEKYFPLELNEEVTFHSPDFSETTSFFDDNEVPTNSFAIKNVGMIKKPGYTIRKLDVRFYKSDSDTRDCDKHKSENCKVASETCEVASESCEVPSEACEVKSEMTVHHYWFHNWADHKCPKDVNALLNLSLDVLKDTTHNFNENVQVIQDSCKCSPQPDSKFVFPPLETTPCESNEAKVDMSIPINFSEIKSPPTIVHCSAGIGRTGCLIAIMNGIKQLSNEEKVDVLGIVCNMRLNRGGMVQNSEQYELIHKVLCRFEQACLPEL